MASRASGWKDLADAASIKTDTTEGDTNDLLTGGTEPPKGCWHTFSRCIGGNNQNLIFLHFVVSTHLSALFCRHVGLQGDGHFPRPRDICPDHNQGAGSLHHLPHRALHL